MGEPVIYEIAEDAKPIGEELIKQFHRHLLESTTPLLYVFRSKHNETNGRPVLAKAKKVSGLAAFLAYQHLLEEEGDSYPSSINVIEIAKDLWFTLNSTQRIALIDHELCHFGVDGGMRGHDVEEFREVIERHGLWKPDIEALAVTIAQQKLFPDDAWSKGGDVSLTLSELGALRSKAESHALELMRGALKSKKVPTMLDIATVGADRIAAVIPDGPKTQTAVNFYVAEVNRFIEKKWDEFRALKGKVLENLKPKRGSGIESVTLTNNQTGKSVTLRADD